VRKLLKEQGLPESDYIISRKGVYCWTPEIPYRCDCISFEEKAEHALKQAEDFGKTELEEAVRLYRGEFLPALGASEWVIFWATKYRKLYMSCVKRLCGIYRDEQEYQKLYEIAEKAAVLYPLDD
jgi:two-component SAPR family response regulator